ncbi:hypothetical protein, variant 4 [Blastomyces dermatitidis ER-3]|uniref:Uncharacterized protein n=2 Tax=Blastomyces TaxID=229219 RepID=A0A179UJB3_BLAGS|nr:uncharacterized protein BDBG_16810 [Blastomyces gilchristii SLH14081]XP_045282262.1 uncharacterized protein BDCG_07706 [Blastomyces dermatitidis ER-3]XP_045282263.1 hypothetical protein, variant 1 [Blastomyces dermatitidis ER-3]XP_045282264.1 hypothetical protein, variant 2 [Blastomyces dermatitidis ER-3]XP_045282265.1 hypothetical protein, variant 3 [Blastomyces dermatitidis ER-3]XP_045282266.1 hypothetical protein, variant 4 [Blastomyces dermatitidis ER-3]OAT02535.1 hypothetical protein 
MTNCCLYNECYFCPSFKLKSDRQCCKYKEQNWKNCAGIFDYTGWKNMRAWQQQRRQGQGAEKEWESGCMNDCGSVKTQYPLRLSWLNRYLQKRSWVYTYTLVLPVPPPNDNSYSLSSSRQGGCKG